MENYIKNTLNYYDENINEYVQEWNIDFIKNYNFTDPDIFLSYLQKGDKILDLGCGSGRDSLYFKQKGFKVKSIDGSAKMCEFSSRLLNERVEQINFLELNYENEFDGIFACASLLHLNNIDLLKVLRKIVIALKNNAYLYASFKYGSSERMKKERYFNDMTEEKFNNILNNIHELELIKTWKSEQYGKHKPFINFILKKHL